MPEELTLGNPLAIVGDADVVSGFQALGFKVYALKKPDEFSKVIDEIVQSNIGICLVEEDIYYRQKEQIENFNKLPLPIFIPFVKDGRMDLLDTISKEIRIRATGAF